MTVTSRPTLCSRARRFRVWAAAAALLLAMPANPLRGPAWAQDTPATPVTIDLGAAGKVDAVVIGANPGDQSDVVAAGDLNGDGLADMVIGTHLSPGPMNLRLHSGAVYAVFGQPILAGGTVLDLALGADLTIYGGFNEDRLGVSVSVGDVNNDGIDDVVMGAPGSDGPGAARSFCGSIHVFFGSRGLRPGSIRDVAGQFGAPPDLTIYGVKALDGLGAATSIADFNGDGLNDLAVSAPNTVGLQPGAFAAGSAYVLFGSPVEQSDPFRDLSAPAPAAPDIVIAGPEPQSTFGLRLANGDFNGDGIADLFASAPVADGPNRGRPNAGQAYVFLGGVTMLARPVRDLSRSGSADVLIYGGDPNDALGLGEVAAGDLNRDGFDDLAVAAPRADGPDNGRVDAGEIYLFFGGPQFQGEVIRDVNGQAGT
ncbi:MAG: FG-GAP repeat protein, partial [Acidobacteria bacterium]|nr:FG-GAP repeat protein [Acidobacteriota bacterium]